MCNWPEEVTVEWLSVEPDFITHDTENNRFVLEQIFENSLARTYRVRITYTVTEKYDVDNPSLTRERTDFIDYTFNVNRCAITSFYIEEGIDDQIYRIYTPAERIIIEVPAFITEPSCESGVTYTFYQIDRDDEMVDLPDFI